jgi:hypothetical protein
MKRLHIALASVAFARASLGGARIATAQSMPSCPGDSVVWENTSTKVYHAQGDSYFGKTKHGQYACKADADKGGFHLAGSSKASKGSRSKAMAASPAPDGMQATSAADAMSSAAPAGKHHRHKHGKGAASPAPSAT